MPRSPQEQMAMTPEVYEFTRKFGRGQQVQEKPSVIQQIAGTLGNVALAGAGIAGAYGLARALGPETPSKGQIGTLNSATVDLNPDYSPPIVESGPEFDVQGDISSPAQQSDFYITEAKPNTAPIAQSVAVSSPTKDERQQQHIQDWYDNPDKRLDEVIALDDAHEERFGIPAGRQIGNIGSLVTGPETVIEASPQKSQGFISAIKQEAQDFNHNIPYGERTKQALESDSALGAAGIIAGTVAEKGAKDVGTRFKKIVTGVPQSINTVKNIASDIGETVTREVINSSIIPDNKMQPSKWAEAARLAAGFSPLGGSGGVEIGNESDLSDNAQFDDPQQQNEQITPAGINRQTSGLAPDPVEGEMQTIAQAVNDLAASFGQGLAHLSPDERVDIARKMIEKDLRKDGYQGPINFG